MNSDAILTETRRARELADIKAAWIMAAITRTLKISTVMKFNKKLREEEKRDFNKNFISGNTDYEEKIDLLNRMRRTSTSWTVWEIDPCVGCNSSRSHFSATMLPCWLRRAARNRHRHAIEQASRRWRARGKFDFHAGRGRTSRATSSTPGRC